MGIWESTVLSLNPTVGFRLDETTLTDGSTLHGNFDGNLSSTVTFTVNGIGTSASGLVYNNSNAAIQSPNQTTTHLWLGPSTGGGSVPAPFNVTTNFRWHGIAETTNLNQMGALIQVGACLAPNIGFELIQSDGVNGNPGSILTLIIPYPTKSSSYPYFSVAGQYQILSGIPFEWFIDNNNGVWTFAVGDSVNGLQILGQAEGLPITYAGGCIRVFFDNYPNWWVGTLDELLFWNTAQTPASRLALFQAANLQAPPSPLIYISTSNLQDTISIPVASGTGTYALAGYNLYSGTASGTETSTAIATLSSSTGSFTPQSTAPNSKSKFYTVIAVDTHGNLSTASNEVSSTTIVPINTTVILPQDYFAIAQYYGNIKSALATVPNLLQEALQVVLNFTQYYPTIDLFDSFNNVYNSTNANYDKLLNAVQAINNQITYRGGYASINHYLSSYAITVPQGWADLCALTGTTIDSSYISSNTTYIGNAP